MRIGNLNGRAVLLGGSALDIEHASEGRFDPDPLAVFRNLAAVLEWGRAIDVDGHPDARPFEPEDLGAPVPFPSQVFGIGLNYADHAAETGQDSPDEPLVFTKFPSSITGPYTTVRLAGDRVDWEAELVAVIGSGGRDIAESSGWNAVAGLMVGQDFSDRTVQNRGNRPQFSLGKSFEGYGPTGPAVVTLDELRTEHDPAALRVQCRVRDADGERDLQDGTTADMIFPIPVLVAKLSRIVELRPGDLIFTGTPAGVGIGRDPQQFLRPGQVLTTEIEGLGSIRQEFTG
ncbi:MAG: 2,4-didehydro-3-deoxy-L-rhamnonate hydrolase [Microbacteriaceae bacterium]|nr:2,4-didehydro-3-deoxy-L-rhamnonate hydrolase [Microbacteriaceae bacterium]